MAKAKRSNLSRTGTKNTTHRVAEFFHTVVAHIVKGQVTNNGEQLFGDVYNEELALGVEVKSSDNCHSWRISVPQLLEHEVLLPFPLSRYVYALCAYKNITWARAGKKKPQGVKAAAFSGLARLKHKYEQLDFLSRKADEIYLLDIEIILALLEKNGSSIGVIPHDSSVPALMLNRTAIHKIRDDAFSVLASIGFNESDFIYRRQEMIIPVTVDDNKYVTSLTLISVLRHDLIRELQL